MPALPGQEVGQQAGQGVPARPAAVIGFAVTGEAVARFFARRGQEVIAVDDRPDDAMRRRAAIAGVTLIGAPDRSALENILRTCSIAVVSPGVPPTHPVFAAAKALGVPITTEIELAAVHIRAPVRMIAVTGTNGKTTVVTLIEKMLVAAGVPAVAAGNIGLPVLDALEQAPGVIVVETSSFQLALTETFRPDVAVWLNVSQDHLDIHGSMEEYVAAKARIWANQLPGDTAIVNADDEIVMERSKEAPSRVTTFGLGQGDYRVEGGFLVAPDGMQIVPVAELQRSFPHDLANDLAASAAAMACGATPQACAATLRGFTGLRHRVELVAEVDGVRYYDDSKATTPASVVAAMEGFDSVVLIAGGRNKGMDMAPLAQCAPRCKEVIAIGEAVSEIAAVFEGVLPVSVASSMVDAVSRARSVARSGDAVVLSPGCASFDWYHSYAERGDDFARCARQAAGGSR